MQSTDRLIVLGDKRYQRGQTVEAIVRKKFPFGILVDLTDGTAGLIRKREISWDDSLSDDKLYQKVSIGDEVRPVVLEIDAERKRLVLSLRRAKYDPWEIIEKCRDELIGSIVRGVVENVRSYGAFVELDYPKGAVGLVHTSRIPEGQEKDINELLWIGDYVEAVITRIDLRDRRIGLDINKRLTKERIVKLTSKDKLVPPDLSVEEDKYQELDEISGDGKLEIVVNRRGIINNILIIDDNEDFTEDFRESLKAAGYNVDSTVNSELGLEKAIGTEYDLIFLDVHLGDVSGIDIVHKILTSRPEVYIIVITAVDWGVSGDIDWSELDLVGVVSKIGYQSEVSRLLQALEDGKRPSTKKEPVEQTQEDPFGRMLEAVKAGSIKSRLKPLLEKLISETESDSGYIFRVDLIRHSVSIVAMGGNSLFKEYKLTDLWHSPVKDVAVERRSVVAKDAKFDDPATFRYLLDFTDFDSCVGFPINVGGENYRYALFLFISKSFHYSEIHQQRAFLATRVAEQLLREGLMELRLRAQQKLMLAGQLGLSYTHEINNKITSLERYAKLALHLYGEMDTNPDKCLNEAFRHNLGAKIACIVKVNGNLKRISNVYLDLAREEIEGEIDINQIIRDIAGSMVPMAKQKGAKIKVLLEDEIPIVKSIRVRLEQVFLNLTLNAIQLLSEALSGVQERDLLIKSSYEPDSKLPVKIRFIDNGPGIHRQRFGWVFEMGTSTRKDGVGLGLFISKGLVESLGGRLSIEDSVMFVGSTFLVELPLMLSEEITG